jgi:hypothetical protein
MIKSKLEIEDNGKFFEDTFNDQFDLLISINL